MLGQVHLTAPLSTEHDPPFLQGFGRHWVPEDSENTHLDGLSEHCILPIGPLVVLHKVGKCCFQLAEINHWVEITIAGNHQL